MKKQATFLLWIFFCYSHLAVAQQKIRIACVGNSITYGLYVVDRAKNSYPAQLQNMLGSNYEVMNFGHSGATVLKNTTNPYWTTTAYTNALASNPDIVLIKLGTNDSKGPQRTRYGEFETTYKELIASFRNLATRPRIIVFTPLTCFNVDATYISGPVILAEINPRVKNVAYDEKLELVDLSRLLIEKPNLFSDKIHPTAIGDNILATRIYEAITQKTDASYDIFSEITEQKTISNFSGFECADFNFNNRNCKVVKPKIAAVGHPWVLRAGFWGQASQTDISLLERGFHIAYCDVEELFGNPQGVSHWNSFYTMMQNKGLAAKVALESINQGSVQAYNWAIANPEKVGCIYADAPVLDLKSWPGGKGTGTGSPTDWTVFKTAYSLTEEQANNFNQSPLDFANQIATLNIPILHVVGDLDNIIPISENTTPFEQKILTAGGQIKVVHKPNGMNQPNSLEDPAAITNFILTATGYKLNTTKIATSGYNYCWSELEEIEKFLNAEK